MRDDLQRRDEDDVCTLPCPRCARWSSYTRDNLRCATCGAKLDFNALRWKTGIWKLNLCECILFGIVSLVLARIGLDANQAVATRLVAGAAALLPGAAALCFGSFAARAILWRVRLKLLGLAGWPPRP
jgi:hypothetical protein